MKTESAPYKIVYILGAGHSGSTLIDMALGMSSNAFSAGELAFYSHYTERIPHKKIDKQKGFVCTCRKGVVACPFWKRVQKEVGVKRAIIKNRGHLDTYKIFINILNAFEKYFAFPIKISKNKTVFDAVYKKALSVKPNLLYLIDSSKDPRRLYELIKDKNINNKNIYVLYLIRDGRAYINSYKKDVRTISGVNKRSMIITMAEWIGVHIACRAMIKKYKLKHLVIRYHDFANNPEVFFKGIFKFLKLDENYGTDNLLKKINKSTYHNLHGSFVKFIRFKKIVHDVSWKTGLSLFEKVTSTILLSTFNYIWVFGRKEKGPYTI